MKLYHNPLSSNARRALVVIEHLGLDVEQKVVDFMKGEHKTPEFLKMNPNGMVPVLQDGDFVLTESRVIEQYLAAKKPEAGLWPEDEQARFDVLRWSVWDAAHFEPPIATITFEKLLKPMMGAGDPDQAKIDAALTRFERFAKVLDGHLKGRDWIVGKTLTVADFTVASSLTYARALSLSLEPYRHLEAWFNRMVELPAWQRTEPKPG